MQACRQRQSLAVSSFLELGADVRRADAAGRTALHGAVKSGADAKLVRQLLDAGADPNAADRDGRRLVIAMMYGLTGPNLCTISACASSNHAVGEGMRVTVPGIPPAKLPPAGQRFLRDFGKPLLFSVLVSWVGAAVSGAWSLLLGNPWESLVPAEMREQFRPTVGARTVRADGVERRRRAHADNSPQSAASSRSRSTSSLMCCWSTRFSPSVTRCSSSSA